ncbi:MAG: PA domain-containing protein [Bacteroidota bacterium]
MLRHLAPLAFLLLSSPVLAQVVGETNAILEYAGTEYAVFATQNYGAQFEDEVPFGPYELIQAIDADGDGPDGDGTSIDGCSPFLNPDDVAGNIALISRGSCPFVEKAENAANAGAVAYIVYMDEREGQEGETLVNMGGDCEPDVCSVPGVFLSRRDYKTIITEPGFAEIATITVDFPYVGYGEINTGAVYISINGDGSLGTCWRRLNCISGYLYEGFTALFASSILVGLHGNVAGSPYSFDSEYEQDASVRPFTDATFDEAFQTAFRSPDLGVLVTLTARARTGDPFVFLQLAAANETAADLTDIYLGLFADWDILDRDLDPDDTSTNDFAAFAPDLGLAYVFDDERAQFYGVMPILTPAYPGARLSGYGTDSGGTDEDMFAALTGFVPPAEGERERAVVLGQGPYTLPADGTPVVQAFALVPGLTEAELFANAEAAQALFAVAAEDETQAGTYALASVYPNPVSTTATVGFTLPVAEQARVEVFDLLGRRVATLADGLRAAGEHRVTLDAAGLPSGVYVVRLATPSATLTERVTVVR